MTTLEVLLFAALLFAFIANHAFLRNLKIYRFCVLIVMPFILCYLFYDTLTGKKFSIGSIFLFLLFLTGLAYQAVKFYRDYLGKEDRR